VTPIDLYAFGNRTGPRPPRADIDLSPDSAGTLGPGSLPFPAGASSFGDPVQAPLTGHYHRLPQGTPLPAGMAVVADGRDVRAQSLHPPTHHTFYPDVSMPAAQFVQLWLGLPWQYAGRKP
jgi:hypothetical protein